MRAGGLLVIALAGAPSLAQEPDVRVEAVFAEWDRSDSPGVAVGVIRDGELIYARGYGMANLEHGIPITPRSVFRIASTSKQFSALCMLLLEREGKLSLDDEIHEHFPEFQDYGTPVTIRQLIHHTSGIRDYLTLMRLAGAGDHYTDEEVVEMLARQKELNFAPGDDFLYSNSGYFLLSQIVLRVTGQSMREFAHQQIFEPLGMTDTHFHDDRTMVVANRASGYSPLPDGGFRISMTTLEMVGDGGIFTTVEDLAKWDQTFYDNPLGGEPLTERQLTTSALNDGTELDYAAGLRVSTYRGLPVVRHGGSFVGYRAEMIRFPEQRFSVICLANLSSISPGRLAERVADIYLEDDLAPRAGDVARPRPAGQGEPRTAAMDDIDLAAYAGLYYSPELDATYALAVNGGQLTVTVGRRTARLAPDAPDRFGSPVGTLRFERAADGSPGGFILDAGRVRNLRFDKR